MFRTENFPPRSAIIVCEQEGHILEVKMELKPDATEKMKEMVPALFTTLSSEYVDISHTLEDGKLIVEYKLKDKDTIIAGLAAKVREGAIACASCSIACAY